MHVIKHQFSSFVFVCVCVFRCDKKYVNVFFFPPPSPFCKKTSEFLKKKPRSEIRNVDLFTDLEQLVKREFSAFLSARVWLCNCLFLYQLNWGVLFFFFCLFFFFVFFLCVLHFSISTFFVVHFIHNPPECVWLLHPLSSYDEKRGLGFH